MRIILLTAAALLLAPAARAGIVPDMQGWANLTAMGSIEGRLLYLAEVQPRFYDGHERLGQLILRGAVGWKLGPSLGLYQGYAHVVNTVEAGRDINEERLFQQIGWTIGKVGLGTLSSRTRFEERWRSDGKGMAFRVRQMLRYAHPLRADARGPNALAHAEAFVATNETGWGVTSGFDQLRSFAGLEVPIAGGSTIEAGYMNQRVNLTRGRIGGNHVLSVSLFYRP